MFYSNGAVDNVSVDDSANSLFSKLPCGSGAFSNFKANINSEDLVILGWLELRLDEHAVKTNVPAGSIMCLGLTVEQL